jgi:protein-S-isoprenylcysteine O-methyltransferase Ste14
VRQSRGRVRSVTWRRLVCYGFAAAVLFLACARPGDGAWLEPWSLAVGTALAVLGEALRLWGCGHLRKHKDVVTSGPYAYVRNPLYLGTLLILVGICIATGNALVVGVLLPAGLVGFGAYYTPKKERIESDRLRRRFGARFDAYHRAVPGYLPRLTRWSGASRARWSSSIFRSNHELPTTAFVLVGLAVVVIAREFAGRL